MQSLGSRNQGDKDRIGKTSDGRDWRASRGRLRKPIEPSLEFKALHSNATMEFIAHNYDRAEQLALEAILVNPEMFPAHSLLSEIHMARGDKTKALAALFHGAHTRPRDINVWLNLAQWIIDRAGEDTLPAIRDTIYCYSRILAVDRTCVDARQKRAAMYRNLGLVAKAAYDYEYLLKQSPYDTQILRLLAEIYIELDHVGQAISYYDHSLRHYQAKEPIKVTCLTWSDINIYCELYGIESLYEKGIHHIKHLSRWLLGRGDEKFWDLIYEDDREWDSKDEPRRYKVTGYVPDHYPESTYGDGLPLELRIKLGVYRLCMGDKYRDEALGSHLLAMRPDNC